MSNYLNYIILPEIKLILEYYQGNIHASDILKFKIRIGENKDYNSNYNIIHDFRDAEFMYSASEMQKLIDSIKNDSRIYAKRKAAYLTETPHQVAATTLFKVMKDEYFLEVQTVSTLEAAMEWVEIAPEYFREVYEYLERLRKDV